MPDTLYDIIKQVLADDRYCLGTDRADLILRRLAEAESGAPGGERLLNLLYQEMDDIRTRASEDMAEMVDPNCYAAGWCAGAIAAIDRLKDFVNAA